MFERYLDFDPASLVIIALVTSVFIIQLLLCLKAKKMLIKLVPIILLVISTVVFFICSMAVNGWDGLGYLFFALLSMCLIAVCGICWLIWAIAKSRNK